MAAVQLKFEFPEQLDPAVPRTFHICHTSLIPVLFHEPFDIYHPDGPIRRGARRGTRRLGAVHSVPMVDLDRITMAHGR